MLVRYITGAVLFTIIVYSGVFCVTFSTVTQSFALVGLALISILTVVAGSKLTNSSSNMSLKLVTSLTFLYFIIRAYYSPVVDLARQDLFLILSAAMLYAILVVSMPSMLIRKYVASAFVVLMILNTLTLVPSIDVFRDNTLNFANGFSHTGLFNHKSFLGNFMALMSCFTLSFALFEAQYKWIRLGAVVLTILGLTAVSISASRGSYLALLGGFLAVAMCWFAMRCYRYEQVNKKSIIFLSIFVVLVVTVGVYATGSYILEERGTAMSDSNGRQYYFSISIEQIPDAPLLGSGSRSVEYKSYENWAPELRGHELDFKFTHNEYIQTIADYGVVGFILLFGVWSWHFISGLRRCISLFKTSDYKNISYAVAGVSMLVAASIHMLLSFPAHGYVNLLLMILGAVLCMGGSVEKKSRLGSEIKRKGNTITWLVVIICCLAYSSIQGVKEAKAAVVFWRNGIIVDDMNWRIAESGKDNWTMALKKVVPVAPTYDRYNKLGLLYLNSKNVENATGCFLESKKLHPFDPIARLNLADIYSKNKNFVKAEEEYLECEYMVKNREDYFMFYRNLAEFYVNWTLSDQNRASACLIKARSACDKSLKKSNGYLYKELRRTKIRVTLLSYYDMVRQKKINEALSYFNDLVRLVRGMQIQSDEDANAMLSMSKEMVKHARYMWSIGRLQRAANILFRAKQTHHRYYGFMKGKEAKEWHIEDKKIDEARSLLIQAGIKAEIK